MFDRIIVAADGSDNSMRAVEQAVELASLMNGSKVELVSVIAVDVYSDMVYDPIQAHSEAQRKTIQPAIDLLEAQGIDHDVVFLHGKPADEIIRYSDETNADLIVIGSRGLSALQEFALGSVSHRVLTHAKRPVLVVK